MKKNNTQVIFELISNKYISDHWNLLPFYPDSFLWIFE